VKYTFFTASVVGYVGHPEALFTRSLADALATRGDDVRVVEPRQNKHYVRTLKIERAPAARAMFEAFPNVQHHTFEMRRGPRLFEWLAREIALLDVAIAVDGIDDELVRWLANLNQPNLIRIFQTYRPESLSAARAAELELELFSSVVASSAPASGQAWSLVRPSVAPADAAAGRLEFVDPTVQRKLVEPSLAYEDLATVVERLRPERLVTPLPRPESPD
jgi:hypothetical protein